MSTDIGKSVIKQKVKELLARAERDIIDCRPFGHSSYGMGVAVGERDAFTEVLSILADEMGEGSIL